MRMRALSPVLLTLAVLAGLGSYGCSKTLKNTILPNQRPTMRLTYAPVDTTQAEFYTYKMNWVGFDADGRVTRFEYAIDPPSDAGLDTEWVATTNNEQTFNFTASIPGDPTVPQPLARDFHVFVIRALDNRGLYSAPIARAFYSFGVAPVVRIDEPAPSSLISPSVTPAVRIDWTGYDYIDPNGYVFEKPLYYKYRIFKSDSDPRWTFWLSHPDSMRTTFAPNFAGWDSTGPDSAFVQYTNLIPNSEYLFVVVAFGRSGAYSPVWNLNTNMLKMAVGFAGQLGPVITLYNSFFSYTYASGGFPSPLDPSWAVQLQVPSGEPLTFNWTAQPPAGSMMRRYRWVMDLVNLDDETERTSQDDWYHWSAWSLTATATVGPFTGAGGDTGEVHNFYVEAEDINGLVSLGWIQFRVFKPTWERNLMIVNDTRFNVGPGVAHAAAGADRQPRGALGGVADAGGAGHVPVRGGRGALADDDPAGSAEPAGPVPGLQLRHAGDAARAGEPDHPAQRAGAVPAHRVDDGRLGLPLRRLAHVGDAADDDAALHVHAQPAEHAVHLGEPGRRAVGAGRRVRQRHQHHVEQRGQRPERRADLHEPGVQHGADRRTSCPGGSCTTWRTGARSSGCSRASSASPGTTRRTRAPRCRSAWQGRPLRDARYAVLPTQLQSRTPATDPLSLVPFRTASDYYVNNQAYSSVGLSVEYLAYENIILETEQVNADSSYEYSALDTLFLAYGPAYPKVLLQAGDGVNGMMTYYHGSENGSVMFLGSSIWSYRRTQCQALVDFVLGSMWGMTKNSMVSQPSAIRVQRARVTTAGSTGTRSTSGFLSRAVRHAAAAGPVQDLPALALTGAVE